MTQTIQLPEVARRIAIDYYRSTPHVFDNGYPDKLHCAFCDELRELSATAHIEATTRPAPTVTEVSVLKPGSYVIKGSCGHEPRRENFFDGRKRPSKKVGDPFDCWTCDTQWHDLNHPGLPEEVRAQIQALVPHCPECGEEVKYIPFLTFTRHDVYFELDGGVGTLDGTSQKYDTVDEQPEWNHVMGLSLGFVKDLPDGWQTGEIAVSCGNDHDWKTRQLAWKSEGSEHKWRVIDTADS